MTALNDNAPRIAGAKSAIADAAGPGMKVVITSRYGRLQAALN